MKLIFQREEFVVMHYHQSCVSVMVYGYKNYKTTLVRHSLMPVTFSAFFLRV